MAGEAEYLAVLFGYSVLAAVALPLPVEALLPLRPDIPPLAKAAVLGLGKGAGAIAVFFVGGKVNAWILRWTTRHPLGERIVRALEAFVRRTGAIGLTVLLSIPFMSDTLVNYFYALMNEEGAAIPRWAFVLANVVGGVARALIFLWLLPGA